VRLLYEGREWVLARTSLYAASATHSGEMQGEGEAFRPLREQISLARFLLGSLQVSCFYYTGEVKPSNALGTFQCTTGSNGRDANHTVSATSVRTAEREGEIGVRGATDAVQDMILRQ